MDLRAEENPTLQGWLQGLVNVLAQTSIRPRTSETGSVLTAYERPLLFSGDGRPGSCSGVPVRRSCRGGNPRPVWDAGFRTSLLS